MPTARKLPSGSWRCQVFSHIEPIFESDGTPSIDQKTGTQKFKRIYESFTSKDQSRQGKIEVELAASKFLSQKKYISVNNVREIGVWDAVCAYCELKCNVLSVSTISGYKKLNKCFDGIREIPLKKLTQLDVQAWVNTLSACKAPKTVRNAHGLLSAVLNIYCPELVLHTLLPRNNVLESYTPTDADIQALIQYCMIHDRDLLVCVCLAAFGTLRRSELCALTASDVLGRTISVTKGIVLSENSEWVVQVPKTDSSIRSVVMPSFVIDLLPDSGPLVSLNPTEVTHHFTRALQKLDIHKFRFHDLRHYSASILHALGIPDQYIMSRGGWKTDNVMKRIYRGTMSDYEKKFTDVAIDHFDKMQHECNTFFEED